MDLRLWYTTSDCKMKSELLILGYFVMLIEKVQSYDLTIVRTIVKLIRKHNAYCCLRKYPYSCVSELVISENQDCIYPDSHMLSTRLAPSLRIFYECIVVYLGKVVFRGDKTVEKFIRTFVPIHGAPREG